MGNSSQHSQREPLISYTQKRSNKFSNQTQNLQQNNKNQSIEIICVNQEQTQTQDQDMIMPQQENPSDFIQYQNFMVQKKCILKVLMIFLIWSLIQFFLIYALYKSGMFDFIDQISPYLFHLSVIFMYGVAKLGTVQFSRQQPYNCLILLLLVFFTTLTYITFCRSFSHQRTHMNDGSEYTTADLVTFFALKQLLFNVLISLTLVIYLTVEKHHIRHFIAIGACCISSFIPLIIDHWLFINSTFAILYGSTLTIVIMQILNGRFQLKITSLITASNILCFGLISPIDLK